MHFNQVRYFLALCEERNFNLAAKRCGVSQPTLSVGIIRLETIFGGELFYRQHRPTQLTELGEAVKPHLKEINSSVGQAHRAAKSVRAARRVRSELLRSRISRAAEEK